MWEQVLKNFKKGCCSMFVYNLKPWTLNVPQVVAISDDKLRRIVVEFSLNVGGDLTKANRIVTAEYVNGIDAMKREIWSEFASLSSDVERSKSFLEDMVDHIGIPRSISLKEG